MVAGNNASSQTSSPATVCGHVDVFCLFIMHGAAAVKTAAEKLPSVKGCSLKAVQS